MNSNKRARTDSGPLLSLDADDTLWENSIWYADATQEFADLPLLRDFSPAQVSIQVDLHDRFGYGEEAFTQAIIDTYRDLAHLRQLGQVSRRPLSLREEVA